MTYLRMKGCSDPNYSKNAFLETKKKAEQPRSVIVYWLGLDPYAIMLQIIKSPVVSKVCQIW